MPKLTIITPTIRPEFLNITQDTLERQTFQDFEWLVEVGLKNRGYGLSKDLNTMIKRAKGEQIVMLQDCIRIEEDALEKMVALDKQHFYTFPVGKVKDWEAMPSWDWRKSPEKKDIPPHYWEADFALAPKEAFMKIGGYDETFDEGWSWENVEVAWRAYYAGYSFFVEPTIVSVALDHDKIKEHPYRETRKKNSEKANQTMKTAEVGKWKLSYI